jgi:predicted GTPase
MLQSAKPVVAVCAVRTGAGKSPTSRRVARILQDAGLAVALVRHPMPYGDLEAMRSQRFGTLAELDAAGPTVEEREEYEQPIAQGIPVFAGVDYGEILARAEAEADVVLWDGGNNDFPFYRPDLLIAVADPLRAGDELSYYPGEAVLRMADVVLVNKLDSAAPADVERVLADIAAVNPGATIVRAESPVTLDEGPSLAGARVLVVEDGPTLTHGGMSFGAGAVAARAAGADLVDPRPYAAGSIAAVFAAFPRLGPLLPAMGYSAAQLEELERTIAATPCDAVIVGTPVDLGRLVSVPQPLRRARYEVRELGRPTLADVLSPLMARLAG